ncbi:hypothetical protein D3C85_841350 [compost metagenome]
MIALDLDQAQTAFGVLGQQRPHQRRFAGASRTPEQCMVGRHAIEKLPGVAVQLLQLFVHADQVGQTHVQADLERH